MSRIKNKEDINLLREGGKRLATILKEVVEQAKPGMKTLDLDKLAHDLAMRRGDKPSFLNYQPSGASRPFPYSLCVSVNDEVVHGLPGERILKAGDVVGLDLGLNHQGTYTDMAVTVVVGGGTEVTNQFLTTTKEALMAGIKAAKVGNSLGDIGSAIEAVAKQAGYGLVRDLAGHFVGHAVHEDPLVPNFGRPGEGLKLKPGMVLAIEPMFTLGGDDVIYLPDGYTVKTADGSLAAHFEHTILITSGEAEILTSL